MAIAHATIHTPRCICSVPQGQQPISHPMRACRPGQVKDAHGVRAAGRRGWRPVLELPSPAGKMAAMRSTDRPAQACCAAFKVATLTREDVLADPDMAAARLSPTWQPMIEW